MTIKVTTWGESHGPAIGAVIEGCPSNLKLSEKDIQKEVDRRKPALFSKISTLRREKDKVRILSGVFEGKTLGTPISLMVENHDVKSKDYSRIKDIYRPGHADYTYDLKYGIRDYRGGGRASGRETVARVMAGAVAKIILEDYCKKHSLPKIEIFGHTVQVGNIKAKKFDKSYIEKNELRCADKEKTKEMIDLIEHIRFKEGDSIGACIEIIIKNPPKGIGEPIFNKLNAKLAGAMMSIGSVKGVEIGAGFKVVEMKGSENNDQMEIKNGKVTFLSNNAGGILGGISTGEDIVLRLAIKPVPSISKELKTIDAKRSEVSIASKPFCEAKHTTSKVFSYKNTTIKTLGRHDTCLAPRIIPVAEAMAAIVLTNMDEKTPVFEVMSLSTD